MTICIRPVLTQETDPEGGLPVKAIRLCAFLASIVVVGAFFGQGVSANKPPKTAASAARELSCESRAGGMLVEEEPNWDAGGHGSPLEAVAKRVRSIAPTAKPSHFQVVSEDDEYAVVVFAKGGKNVITFNVRKGPGGWLVESMAQCAGAKRDLAKRVLEGYRGQMQSPRWRLLSQARSRR